MKTPLRTSPNGTMHTIPSPEQPIGEMEPINKSVGLEFIEWAEKYWHLDKIVNTENPDTFAGEVCDYKYMRQVFVDKINALIADRLAL